MAKLKTTVTAFIFHDKKLLIIKHKKTGKWLHVGGHVEKNETLDEALHREIKEEVNLDVTFLEEYNHSKSSEDFKELPRPFYIHAKNYGNHRKMSFDFLCIAEKIDELRIQDEELEDFKWLTHEEVKNSAELWEPIQLLALKAFEVYNKWVQHKE
jgi:ADP-ribose pyrophosphatase YjhB (NUDIX family)